MWKTPLGKLVEEGVQARPKQCFTQKREIMDSWAESRGLFLDRVKSVTSYQPDTAALVQKPSGSCPQAGPHFQSWPPAEA